MAPRVTPWLWVMEGYWSPSVRDVRTVSPIVDALETAGRARYAMRRINDTEDLERELRRWGQAQHQRFNIGYLALHGSPGAVHIGRKTIHLGDLGDCIPAGALSKKVLHFGSCSVLDLKPSERKELKAALGVKAITGFTTDVEWFESMAFELLLFEVLTRYKRLDAAEAYLHKHHTAFARRLGFVMVR